MRKLLSALIFLCPAASLAASPTWVIQSSTLTYHVSHPLHQVEGVSHSAKGKGVCSGDVCDFLIGAPVNSFDSGDSNRDLHMLQVVKGGQFPLVVVRISSSDISGTGTIGLNVEVNMSGQKVVYAKVPIHRQAVGDFIRTTGELPLRLTDLKIDRPSLLGMPIKDEAPVDIDIMWSKAAPAAGH